MNSDVDAALNRVLGATPACFGEIEISRSPESADSFELRHVKDLTTPAAELTLYRDPEDAATLALYDDLGRYRPLKTAPNLRRGWRLVVPDLPALRLALEGFYPARLGAWIAFQERRLAVTPLRETLGRQSGMYRVTQKLTDEQADALVARFCRTDGGCLRTILWTRDAAGAPASTGLPPEKFDPVAAGPDAIPLLCQEACNLLVAEARRVVKGEVTAAGG